MSDSGQNHLSNELRLEASLSEKGISGRVRSRAVAALDRLLGSMFDIPTAKMEAASRRIRARSDQESKLIASETVPIKNALENDKELGRIIAEHQLSSRAKYIANKHNVGNLAIEYLSKEDSNEEQDSEDISLEEDWLNYFEQYAEKASSDRMRDLWARVLAGEIRKPQSFSLITLRFLAELDQEIASLFENVTEHRMSNVFILHPGLKQMRGQLLFDLTFLEEVGLLQNISPGLSQDQSPNAGVVFWREGDYLLRAGAKKSIKLEVIRITRVGREITSILPPTDKVSVLEHIANKIENKVSWLEIHKIVKEEGSNFLSNPIKIIKTEDGIIS